MGMVNARRGARLRVPARASLWYIASSALARSIGVAGTPIFTRLLTTEEYGLFPHYNTWLSLIAVIATLEVSGSVIYRGLQRFESRKAEFISATLGLCFTVCAFVCTLFFTFLAIFGNFTSFPTGIFVLMFAHIILNATVAIYTTGCRYEYRYKTVALTNIVTAVATPVLSIAIIFLTPYNAEARIFGQVAVAFLLAVPFLVRILRRSRRVFDRDVWRFLLKFNLPLLPHYLSAAVIIRIGEVMLGIVYGNEALAKYSVAMSVGLSLTVITGGLLSALSPWLIRKIRDRKYETARELLYSSSLLLSLVCLCILAVAPETIRIVAPPEYYECLPAVFPLALSVVPTFLSQAVVSGEMYFEKSGISSLPTVISAVICTLLTVFLLPRVDYRLVSVFVLLSYVTMCVLNCFVFKRMSGESPVYTAKTAMTFLVTVLYATLLLSLREYPTIRIIAALPVLPPLFTVGRGLWVSVREKGEE